MGVSVSNECQYRDHLGNTAKLTGTGIDWTGTGKVGVIGRARHYFTTVNWLFLYRAQARSYLEYSSHLWSDASQYYFERFDHIPCRAIRIVGDTIIYEARRYLLCFGIVLRNYLIWYLLVNSPILQKYYFKLFSTYNITVE